jgi:hypothetical protein
MRKISEIFFLVFCLYGSAFQAAEVPQGSVTKPSAPDMEKLEAKVTPYLSAYKDDQIFAIVNAKPILYSDIKPLYKRMMINFFQVYPDKTLTPEKVKEICAEVLDKEIKKTILVEEIEKKQLYPADPELDDQFQKIKMQYGVYFSQFLNTFKIKEEDYRKEVKFRMGASKLMNGFDKDVVLPQEQDAEKWYNDNKQKFLVPRQIQFSIICMNNPENADKDAVTKIQKRLEDLRSEIETGKRTFEEGARNFSDEPNSRKNGGNVGPVYTKDIKSDFALLTTLKLDVISPVTVYSQGFFIAKITKEIPESTMLFPEVKDKIVQGLKMDAFQKHRQESLDKIWKEAKVEIKETSLLTDKKEQK